MEDINKKNNPEDDFEEDDCYDEIEAFYRGDHSSLEYQMYENGVSWSDFFARKEV